MPWADRRINFQSRIFRGHSCQVLVVLSWLVFKNTVFVEHTSCLVFSHDSRRFGRNVWIGGMIHKPFVHHGVFFIIEFIFYPVFIHEAYPGN